MKKIFAPAVLTVLCLNFTFAQPLSKGEKKQIKAELKGYLKNPASYKSKMQDLNSKIQSGDEMVARLKSSLDSVNSAQADLQDKLASDDATLKALQAENDSLKSVPPSRSVDMKNPPAGTIYKVQLGLYKELNLNKYFDEPRYVGYEEVDGMNRYVISYFPDEQTAQNFVADIRKLGVRDAFVAKYIDGVRVYEWNQNPKYKGKKVPDTLEEAISEAQQIKQMRKK